MLVFKLTGDRLSVEGIRGDGNHSIGVNTPGAARARLEPGYVAGAG